MITWAQSVPRDDVKAYSVRPDLWPPGWVVRTSIGEVAEWNYKGPSDYQLLADQARCAARSGLGTPGTVESLVLGGGVLDAWVIRGFSPWAPCPAPGVHSDP